MRARADIEGNNDVIRLEKIACDLRWKSVGVYYSGTNSCPTLPFRLPCAKSSALEKAGKKMNQKLTMWVSSSGCQCDYDCG